MGSNKKKTHGTNNHEQEVPQSLTGEEGARRATGSPVSDAPKQMSTEVKPKKPRRYLTASYKLKILTKIHKLRVDGRNGSIGAFLRSEGLYYSTINRWEKQLNEGKLQSKRGVKKHQSDSVTKEKKALKRKVAQLEKNLDKANALLEIQKKIVELKEMYQEPGKESK